MNSVLLLNADYTPLRVIPVRRAIGLMLAGKVEPLAEDVVQVPYGGEVMSVPVVLRLGYVVKIPFTKMNVPCNKRGILARDNHECQFIVNGKPCAAKADTVDHLHPKSRGGDTMSWENLVGSCGPHNHKKGNRTLEEMGWKLKRKPVAPRAQVRVLRTSQEAPAEWAQFLPAM